MKIWKWVALGLVIGMVAGVAVGLSVHIDLVGGTAECIMPTQPGSAPSSDASLPVSDLVCAGEIMRDTRVVRTADWAESIPISPLTLKAVRKAIQHHQALDCYGHSRRISLFGRRWELSRTFLIESCDPDEP